MIFHYLCAFSIPIIKFIIILACYGVPGHVTIVCPLVEFDSGKCFSSARYI